MAKTTKLQEAKSSGAIEAIIKKAGGEKTPLAKLINSGDKPTFTQAMIGTVTRGNDQQQVNEGELSRGISITGNTNQDGGGNSILVNMISVGETFSEGSTVLCIKVGGAWVALSSFDAPSTEGS